MGAKFLKVGGPSKGTNPTSALGQESAQMKSLGYQARSQGNAASKALGGAKSAFNLSGLGPFKNTVAAKAPGPKRT